MQVEPRTLDAVVADLTVIVDDARRRHSCTGLFASMYRSVTSEIRATVRRGGFFTNDERMEQLAVVFADRYIDAYHGYRAGRPTTESWRLAFDYAEAARRRMILQHLLLGMNAHINLDLGIATAEVVPEDLPTVYEDFLRINEILFQMVDDLQANLGAVSPRMSWFDRMGVGADEAFMRLGIRTARDMAWRLAEHIVETDPLYRAEVIDERDRDTAQLARAIAGRWSPVHLAGWFVAGAERDEVETAIDSFATLTVDLNRVEHHFTTGFSRQSPPTHRLSDVVGERGTGGMR